MQQAWPVPGSTLCTAPGISPAVFRPPGKALSNSPLITNVGTFIVPRRGVVSALLRALNTWAMASGTSRG